MRLWASLFISMLVITVISGAVIVGLGYAITLPRFEAQEMTEVSKGVTMAFNALNVSVAQIEGSSKDWAYWDDTYRFLQGNNTEFVEINIYPEAFKPLKVDLMLFFDASGGLYYGAAYNHSTGEELPIPEGLKGEMAGELLRFALDGGRSGVISLPEGVLLFSVQPVLRSTGDGAPAGALFFGRFVDQELVDLISRMLLIPVAVVPYGSGEIPKDFLAVRDELPKEGTVVVPVNSSSCAGYGLVYDAFGEPALMVKILKDREVFNLSTTAMTHTVIGILAATTASLFVFYGVIVRRVLRRVSKLREELVSIGEAKDFSRRVKEGGSDEISDLAKSANWMLASLEESKRELEMYSKHFEGLVQEKTKELLEKERLAAIGETALMVGHDLRNPLQAMINAVFLAKEKILAMNLEDSKKKEFADLYHSVQRQILYMNKIISDLQDLCRPLRVEKTTFPVGRAIDEVLKALQVPSGVKVEVEVSPPEAEVNTDPLIIKRILTNLVNNAIQAMPEEGGEIKVKASVSDGELRLVVSDTGVGIDEARLAEIFKPFKTTKAKGTGLGLAIVKRLVDVLHGRIEVQSAIGRGTTFTITIPIENGET